METKSYIKIYPGMLEEPLFTDGSYDRWHAWCDLLLSAFYGPRKFGTRGKILTAPIGSVYITYATLTKRWGWTNGRVQRFLKKLSDDGKIKINVDNVICITIISSNIIVIDNDEEILIENTPVKTPPKPKKKVAKKAVKPVTLVTQCRKVFEQKYLETFEAEYYWNAKDAASMKLLIDKIKYARERRNLTNEDEDITQALGVLLNSITDKWLLSNFSVCNINSKYNEIVAQARLTINSHGKTDRIQRQADAINVVSELEREEQSVNSSVWK